MSFKLLAPHLHATAEAAQKYFSTQLGAKRFKFEESIDDHSDFSLKPTLSAKLNDGYILCVEVSEKAYSNSLDTFVVECSTEKFPVKLYVVVPSGKGDADFAAHLKAAKARGVGVIELGDTKPFVASDAVSLSFFGLRRNELKDFPKGKREAIRLAQNTFLNGNPVKGCQSLYEELEAVTRAFASRSLAEGWWRAPHPGEAAPGTDLETGPWAAALRELATFIDIKVCKKKCPKMNESLIASVRGVTDPRNLTSHKPKSVGEIIERDQKLRTWFETTSDLLKSWCDATMPLKI